jgi:hypothetical protein
MSTNVSIYRAIAVEAHEKMHESLVAGRRPRADGGWIMTYDPTHTSFKHACIAIAFTGMWLEAAIHLAIVREHGVGKARRHDGQSYEDKLQFLRVTDRGVIGRARRLRLARNELAHEKAHLNNRQVRIAQREADSAHELLVDLRDLV